LAAAGVIVVAPAWARAQATAGVEVSRLDDRQFATLLAAALRSNDFAKALALLEAKPSLASDPAAIRLRAQLLATTGRVDEALALLESRLARDPKDALARFQLAEVHFAAKRDAAAVLAYHLALAGRLDEARRRIVESRLAAISERRRWQVTAGLSLTPDSNLNGGSDATSIRIFGLPFELDDDARRRRGVSLGGNLGVTRRVRLDDRDSMILEAGGAANTTFGAEFDTAELGVQALLEHRRESGTLAFGPTANGTWLNGDLFQTAAGIQLGGDWRNRPDQITSGVVRLAHLEDSLSADRNGTSLALDVSRTRFKTASTLQRTGISVERRVGGSDEQSYWYGHISHGWLRPVAWSVSAYVEPFVAIRRFDAPSAFFGVARRDQEYGVSLRLSKRDLVWGGAFPYVAATVSRNQSNIALNRFSRSRLEFGMTRQF
jgi:hypothetical protein